MKRLVVSADAPDASVLAEAAAVIRAGGLVAFPTDTVYGIAADPRSDEAVARLFELKGRDRGTAVPLIAADIEQARAAGDFGPREMRLAEAFWPGPLSIVVPGGIRAVARRTGRAHDRGDPGAGPCCRARTGACVRVLR